MGNKRRTTSVNIAHKIELIVVKIFNIHKVQVIVILLVVLDRLRLLFICGVTVVSNPKWGVLTRYTNGKNNETTLAFTITPSHEHNPLLDRRPTVIATLI